MNHSPPDTMLRKIIRELFVRAHLASSGLGLVWQTARRWTTVWALLLLLQGLVPAIQVSLIRLTVNDLAQALGAHESRGLRPSVWIPVVLIALLWIVGQILSSLVAWVRSAQAELVQDHIHALIQAQALKLDLAFFEQPDSYDLLHRARVDALSQPLALLENLGAIVQNGLTLLALAVMLATYTPWLPLLLIGSALPGLLAVARHTLREHHWRLQNTANERRARYFDWMMTERGSAAEMRLFGLGPFHRHAFHHLRTLLRTERLRIAQKEVKAELTVGALTWSGGLAGMAWMIWRSLQGLAQLGDIVLCYQAFQQSQRLLRALLGSAGKLYRGTLFLENLHQFLSLQPQVVGPPDPRPLPELRRASVRFENVTFRYPGDSSPALRDFTLELPAEKVVAIVGHNGAGKSTLIKLLCRFYDPQEGRVSIGGMDLRKMDLPELRRRISVLFQDPVHYHATASENIAMGDLAVPLSSERIIKAARDAGADGPISHLPSGYETVLGKWFGGAELSVGEWQRVALARAFLRQASIVILDEPTSAMDSWAEADWLCRFRELTQGRTTLMITHRFTTAMHADLIHVMSEGRIIESGTHAQLVANGGHYAESWQAQMRGRACA